MKRNIVSYVGKIVEVKCQLGDFGYVSYTGLLEEEGESSIYTITVYNSIQKKSFIRFSQECIVHMQDKSDTTSHKEKMEFVGKAYG